MIDELNKGDRIKSTTSGEIYEVDSIEGDVAKCFLIWSTMTNVESTRSFHIQDLMKSPFWKKSYDTHRVIKPKEKFITPENIDKIKFVDKHNDSVGIDKPNIIDSMLDWTMGYPFKDKVIQDGVDKKKNWRYIVTIDDIISNAVIVKISVNGFIRNASGEVHTHNPEYKMKLNKDMYEELISDIPAFCDKKFIV